MNRPLFSSSAHAASRAASNEFCESPSRRVEFLVLACLFLIVLCMTNPTDRCLGAGAERHGPRALKDFWRGPRERMAARVHDSVNASFRIKLCFSYPVDGQFL